MLKGKTVAVVVPSYNEESQIEMVIEMMPEFVDRIIVVDDCSNDKTSELVRLQIGKSGKRNIPKVEEVAESMYNQADLVAQVNDVKEIRYFTPFEIWNENEEDRIVLIRHGKNAGVGAAIATGYKWCKDHRIDCTAVMAGDGQMDPSELESICLPVIEEGVDYVKGNRLIHRSASTVIPNTRFIGNSILSILTKIASGYWHVSDTQTGYTAIGLPALRSIQIFKIYKRYGMPNDLLVKLNTAACSLKEVEIKPVYNVGEQSKMKIMKVIPTVSWLLIKSFFKRLWMKYLFRDFHPLFLLYHFSFVLFAISIPYMIKIIKLWQAGSAVNELTAIATMFLLITSSQSFLFAMWMDIQDNERLYRS